MIIRDETAVQQRKKRARDGHVKFAWRPVMGYDGKTRWLQRVFVWYDQTQLRWYSASVQDGLIIRANNSSLHQSGLVHASDKVYWIEQR